MKAELIKNERGEFTHVTVTRTPDDPVFRGVRGAKGESWFLYHLKLKLNSMGHSFVKKRMHKDGHLVDDRQQYLREVRPGPGGRMLAIFNENWCIRGAEEEFNRDGKVNLACVDLADGALDPVEKKAPTIHILTYVDDENNITTTLHASEKDAHAAALDKCIQLGYEHDEKDDLPFFDEMVMWLGDSNRDLHLTQAPLPKDLL